MIRIFGGFCALISTSVFAQDLEFSDIYAISANPSAKVGAVFMVIENQSDQDRILLEVQTEAAKKAELHTHRQNEEGVMQMRELENGIPVPANSCVFLARGGLHVMMMKLHKGWEQGDEVEINLIDDQGQEYPIIAKVDRERGNYVPPTPEAYENCLDADHHSEETDDMDMGHQHNDDDHGDAGHDQDEHDNHQGHDDH